jgi:hypothetical protein
MAVTMKLKVFWDVICSIEDVYRRFEGTVKEYADSPDRSVGVYQTARCYNSIDVILVVTTVGTITFLLRN